VGTLKHSIASSKTFTRHASDITLSNEVQEAPIKVPITKIPILSESKWTQKYEKVICSLDLLG